MGVSRDSDDDGYRWYEDDDGNSYLSVTSVLEFLDEDETGLERWRETNDGTDGSPHHEHIFWYSGPRGTLCHYHALNPLTQDGRDMWDDEEQKSMQAILDGPDADDFEEASADEADVVYSLLRYRDTVSGREEFDALFADSVSIKDCWKRDTDWFDDAFAEAARRLGVTEESVIGVERKLVNDDVGYGGQCDLVYEDPSGNVVVADLKTSSGLRQKHRLQSVAYKNAVEQADWGPDKVDRVEVWRLYPDDQQWCIHSHEVPEHAQPLADEDRYTDEDWFTDPWGKFDYDDLGDMWDTFQRLVETAHERRAADD